MMSTVRSDLINQVAELFDLGEGHVSIAPGARGAQGEVWRLTAGRRVYALKQVFAGTPPSRADVESEVVLTRRAAAAGVHVPLGHPDRNGDYIVPLPAGGWLRLFDWVELRPAHLAAAAEALGVLLARLHRSAPPAAGDPGGGPAHRWYEVPPDREDWGPLVTAASTAGMSWASRLAVAADGLPALHSLLSSTDAARMRLCHRDLHPGNVLADDAGELVVVDWDDVGPADPARELAATLVACYHDGQPDLDSMRRAYKSYVAAGGPARLTSAADFTMLIATQLNFLHRQVQVALDQAALPRDRHWAELEIDESLRILPTPDLLATVLDALCEGGATADADHRHSGSADPS